MLYVHIKKRAQGKKRSLEKFSMLIIHQLVP